MSWLINALVDVETGDEKSNHPISGSSFPSSEHHVDVDRLVHILDLATETYNDEEIDMYGSPLVKVFLQIAESGLPRLKARLQALLLPSSQKRDAPLGSGSSLPARLLRLSTAPMASNMRALIPMLLFELSDNDVEKFVRNIGYGYAAGYLASKGLPLPAGALDSWASGNMVDNNTGYTGGTVVVNPITGQRRDRESDTPLPEMTDAEKEREAERLFVLFERWFFSLNPFDLLLMFRRLRETGVVNVENPVAQAARQGRFEELDSDDDQPDK